ncbi:Mitochondrial fission ELM1 family protein [Candidatus Bealeia paramacronuclearis]|uniref:Mitochondrial fission ELM1 family protein n=1 Tax=Candidatus Bealeia paramacronuclearis TaxID=1921001 RepID=A0ABZ2C608_9PROT|nr:Mitochondrial fission ELM1 family protein [Candidatus Bealeia paramacronuclearis]
MTKLTPRTCWTLSDGHPGMMSQVIGLSESLGLETIHKVVNRRWPYSWMPTLWPFGTPTKQLDKKSDSLAPPWPDVVISCGRRSVALALSIKKQNKGKTYLIHIQDPLISPRHLDLVAAPEHDKVIAPNVIKTFGALHKVSPQKLETARSEFKDYFSHYENPFYTVLLGGATNRYAMPQEAMEDLISSFDQILRDYPGSLLITPSFRTPYRDLLKTHFANHPRVFLAEPETFNPYFGMLALANAVLVTDDSVNMMTEACATGKPVYILPLRGHENTKPIRFASELIRRGYAKYFDGIIDFWEYRPFNETARVGNLIKSQLGLR